MPVIESVISSSSTSLIETEPKAVEFSAICNVDAIFITGASFTGEIETATVAVDVFPAWLIVYVNESSPFAFVFGTYEITPPETEVVPLSPFDVVTVIGAVVIYESLASTLMVTLVSSFKLRESAVAVETTLEF